MLDHDIVTMVKINVLVLYVMDLPYVLMELKNIHAGPVVEKDTVSMGV